jgi:predicted DNA-binding transcriptional regulator AlpA
MGRSLTKTDEREALQDELLCCEEVAKLLRVSEDCIAAWRRLGKGPAFIRFGLRVVRYRHRDVLAWISRQEVQPTCALGSRSSGSEKLAAS